MSDHLYMQQTAKKPAAFVNDLKMIVESQGFLLANEQNMNMAETFKAHGAEISHDFDLYMVQICKPDKAAGSLQTNPERAILMPKFVMVFSNEDRTEVRFHHYSHETITAMLDDTVFPHSLAATYEKIIGMIEQAL